MVKMTSLIIPEENTFFPLLSVIYWYAEVMIMRWTLDEAISYYKKMGAPQDQSALIGLLREIQQENGGSIPGYTVGIIAKAYGIKESLILALVKRIPSLRLGDSHCLELCAGPNCGKHAALAAYAEQLHTACRRKFTLKFVPCMRMCAKGPNLKWDGTIYHKADKELLEKLLRDAKIDF